MPVESVYSVTIGLGFFLVAVFAIILIRQKKKSQQAKYRMQEDLHEAQAAVLDLKKQLQATLLATHKFVEARDENEIIEILLSLVIDLTGAMGVSFVPLDEKNQPMASVRRGEFPIPVPDAWLEYLATPNVRQGCSQCTKHEAHDQTCALMRGPFSDVMGLYCFPLRYGEKELGLLNLYFQERGQFEEHTRYFLNAIVDVTALALEGERLRQREWQTLSHIQIVRDKPDLRLSILSSLQNLHSVLNVDVCLIVLDSTKLASWTDQLQTGQAIAFGPVEDFKLREIEELVRARLLQDIPQIKSDTSDNSQQHITWLAVKISSANRSEQGILVVVNLHKYHFTPRRIHLVQAAAEQIGILITNSDQLARLEFKIVMDERTRLSREIHDGLAQTLGFLKLQVAQMLGYLDRNDFKQLGQAVKNCYDALSTAYQDARLAIDGLRVSPLGQDGYKIDTWLRQIVQEFEAQSFDVRIDVLDLSANLPPEIHAQLIRIVQEALSNVRKHAQTSQVWISCFQQSSDLTLEIRDNGQGFTPGEIPDPYRYGLRGMQERAELIGADFQVISRPGQGTTVRLRLPLETRDWMEA